MKINGYKPREIWVVDFEFSATDGNNPSPICMVAWEFYTGQKVRLWEDELRSMKKAPYATDDESLFVAYYASAEMGCHLELGWELPSRVLDLYVEFRNHTNGKQTPFGTSLLGALAYFGINGIDSAEKRSMRELALRGGPWSSDERNALLDYCESDVAALSKLLGQMSDLIDLKSATFRGDYMPVAAQIERNGIPIDTEALSILEEHWTDIQEALIKDADKNYGVYEGTTFKGDKWAKYLVAHDIPWKKLPTGNLALDQETFKQMADLYPQIEPICELRGWLSQMRLTKISVGNDGRNRCLLSAYGTLTGRNTPSNSKFIFGHAAWLRGLIKPAEGYGIAYIDWEQQEFGIAAGLSQDEKMKEAYETGDPYLAFAKQAGAVPTSATKETHSVMRERFKHCALGVLYGMGAEQLAKRTACSVAEARQLLKLHRQTYRDYWGWSQDRIDRTVLLGWTESYSRWRLNVTEKTVSGTLANFPMQSGGAEMLRLAARLANSVHGVKVCALVHDAILIEAPLSELETAVERTQAAMSEASFIVNDRFLLRSDAKLIRYPDRFKDARGDRMWDKVWKIVEGLKK